MAARLACQGDGHGLGPHHPDTLEAVGLGKRWNPVAQSNPDSAASLVRFVPSLFLLIYYHDDTDRLAF
jgi:hypothetical protein